MAITAATQSQSYAAHVGDFRRQGTPPGRLFTEGGTDGALNQ